MTDMELIIQITEDSNSFLIPGKLIPFSSLIISACNEQWLVSFSSVSKRSETHHWHIYSGSCLHYTRSHFGYNL